MFFFSRQIYKLTALCTEEAGFSSSSWRGRLKKLSWAGPDLSRGLQFVSIFYGLVSLILKWPKQWLIKYSETINFLRINPRTFAIGAPKVSAQTSFQFAKLCYIQGYSTTSIFPFNWVQFFFFEIFLVIRLSQKAASFWKAISLFPFVM